MYIKHDLQIGVQFGIDHARKCSRQGAHYRCLAPIQQSQLCHQTFTRDELVVERAGTVTWHTAEANYLLAQHDAEPAFVLRQFSKQLGERRLLGCLAQIRQPTRTRAFGLKQLIQKPTQFIRPERLRWQFMRHTR